MIEAAESLFEEHGVQAATVAEICERADVAHKTFFNHFPTKQDLVRAMADASIEILLEEIERARSTGRTTDGRLRLFFESVAERATSAGPMHRELLTEIIHAAQRTADEPANARRLHAAFRAIVDDGVAAGEVTRRHPPETLTETIVGAYYALMFNWANLDGYPIAARARAAASFLADALAPREAAPDAGDAKAQPRSRATVPATTDAGVARGKTGERRTRLAAVPRKENTNGKA